MNPRTTLLSGLAAAGVVGSALMAGVTAQPAQAASNVVVLHAKTSLASGVGAHIQVRVNGTVLSQNTLTNTSYADVKLNLPWYTKASDKVEVLFDNDTTINGQDRNLWLQSMKLADGTVLQASSAVLDAGENWVTATDGKNTSTTSAALWGNGALRWAPVVAPPAPQPSVTPSAASTPSAAPVTKVLPSALQGGAGSLYADMGDTPATRARDAAPAADKPYINVLVKTPTAAWYDGVSGNGNAADGDNGADNVRWMTNYVNTARNAGKVPQVALYGIPGRDCGAHSAGGLSDAAAYKAWVDKASSVIGSGKAVVIVEPDAISYCGSDAVKAQWAPLMTYVGEKFKANNPNAALYLHAGSGQLTQEDAANAVIPAGIANMRGFALNVAGLSSTANAEAWSNQFVKTLEAKGVKGMHYVVDTARSGIDHPANPDGPHALADYNSCNNASAAAGPQPSTTTPHPAEDAYLWIKGAGASDGGKCHIQRDAQGRPLDANGNVITSSDRMTILSQAVGLDPVSGAPHPVLAAAVVRNGVTVGTVPASLVG